MNASLHFSEWGWAVLLFGALGVGLNKGGLTGLSILFVVCFAAVLPAKASTGLVLPMLMVGDLCAIIVYHRAVIWKAFWALLPPALVGIVIGWQLMDRISETVFRPLIGWIVLTLVALQLLRGVLGPKIEHLFESRFFGIFMGVLAGITTMLANAAGPVSALYFLSVRLQKWNLIGTTAVLFFTINCCKVPFSAEMGLINSFSLKLSLALAPLVILGFFGGRYLASIMPQKFFERFLLFFTFLGALRLIL